MIELYLNEAAQALDAELLGHNVKFKGCSTDTRLHLLPDTLYVALRGKHFDGHEFVKQAQQQGAAAVMVERSINCELPVLRVPNTRKALGNLAYFWRQRFDLPLVAITGSNGKTTTKEMLRAIFAQQGNVLANQGNLNNDIGVPLTLFNLQADHRYAVIEMGANHAGEIANLTHLAKPTVALITQCAPAHLDGFKDIEGVARAKGEIFTGLRNGGTAIINQDDDYADLWLSQLDVIRHSLSLNLSTFALDNPAEVTAHQLHLNDDSSDFILHTNSGDLPIHLPLLGRHNVMNALAATAGALACGCSLPAIQQGLQSIQPVKGRLQRCAGLNHTTLIDDTYNANPTSLNAALAVLKKNPPPHWLVLGDMNELGPHSEVFHRQAGQQAQAMGVQHLYATGSMTRYAVEGFGAGAQHFTEHDDLIDSLRNELPNGATVLIKGSRGMQMEKIVNALRS